MKTIYLVLCLLFVFSMVPGCAQQAPEQETIVYKHILISPKEYTVVHDEPVVAEMQTMPQAKAAPIPMWHLGDAGDICFDTTHCQGFCLSYRGNVSRGFCSDTHHPQGCYWLLHQGNASLRVCS